MGINDTRLWAGLLGAVEHAGRGGVRGCAWLGIKETGAGRGRPEGLGLPWELEINESRW